MHKRFAAAAVIAATIAVLAWQMAALAKSHLLMGDFRAFYCGGSVVVHRENPYEAAPIMACESTPQPFGFHRAPRGLAEPVPFPGYAFALFVPFALLPFVPSACAWLAFLIVAMGISCALLARMCGRSFDGIWAVFALGYSIAVLTYGELASVTLLGLVAAAYALRRSRYAAAAAALCCAAILPHVAAPVFAAVFLCVPRARLPLALGAAALVALDLTIGGPTLALSYFTRVLPAHAQSEIGYITQYGLTWLLHAAGFSDRAALICGDASYLVMAAAGVFLGRALSRRFDEPAFVTFTPACFAAIGGPFMHYSEITLALPLLILLAVRTQGATKVLTSIALVLVALPWQWVIQPSLIVAFAGAAYLVTVLFLKYPTNMGLRAALGAAGYCALIVVCGAEFGAQLSVSASAHLDPRLAQSSWADYIRINSSSSGIVWLVAKVPTWTGLGLSAFCCAYALAKKNFVAAVAVEQVPARA